MSITTDLLRRYILEYREEISNKPKEMVLDCEAKSLAVLQNEEGFENMMKRMKGKETLEEAFFIEMLESFCEGTTMIIILKF